MAVRSLVKQKTSLARCSLIALTLLLSTAPLLAQGTAVKLRRADGTLASAQLIAIDNENLQATIGGTSQTLPIAELLAVELSSSKLTAATQAWLELIDGSKLHATSFTTATGTATVKLVSGQTITLPTRSLAAVRFRAPETAVDPQWRDIVTADLSGDLLVIRKTAEASEDEPAVAGGVVLDQLDGTILSVAEATVSFDFDGEKIDVRREKLEGIAFFQPTKRTLVRPICQVIDRSGGRWMVKSMKLDASDLAIETPVGLSVKLPLADLASIDLAAGNLLFLTDLEPERREAAFGLQPPAMTATFAELYRNRTDGEVYKLGGKSHARALALHGKTSLTFRVPEGFSYLRGVVGIDDVVQASSSVKLTIVGDNRELFQGEFDSEKRGPIDLDLDVSGVRRLVITLTPQGPDLRSQLLICQPRLSR